MIAHPNRRTSIYYYHRVSQKKCVLRRLVQMCNFFRATLLYGVFKIFFENLYFFGTSMVQKKIREPFFSFKIKSSVKQKCVNKLFLLKSKILKRLNHRISENLQNCN